MKKFTLYVMALTLLLSLLSATALAAPIATPTGVTIDKLESEIDNFMAAHIDKSSPGAAVAVVKNGEIVFTGAYGKADIEKDIPVDDNTVFEYGSINKLFVWTLVMQLVEQGKLNLDADICDYLPDEFAQELKLRYPITMRNIMNHSAGFGEYPFDGISTAQGEEVALPDILLNLHPNQYFEPGTASVYSNYATGLAAYVVECISDKPFYQYQKENIFDKLGMSDIAGHMRWQDNIGVLENKAQGYNKMGKNGFRNTGWSYVSLYPVGSVSGTATDLAKLAIALMPAENAASPLFQNPNTLPEMLTPSYESGASGTAHGFFELDSVTSPAFGHGGNTLSFSAQFVIVPKEQFGLVVLTNAGNEFDILFGLQELLVGNKVPLASGQEMPDAHDLVGSYVTMRRAEKTPLEFVGYLSAAKVQAIDENTINFKMSIFSAEYLQTAPYVFEVTEDANPVLRAMYNRLEFKMENGKPVQIMIGNGMDMSDFSPNRPALYLMISAVVLIACVLFFLISPVGMIISSKRRKKKNTIISKPFARIQTALTLSGMALLLNNIIMILLMLSNPMIRYAQITPFVIISYIITALSALLLVLGFVNLKKETTTPQKRYFVITGVLMILFVLLLINWNVFVIYI